MDFVFDMLHNINDVSDDFNLSVESNYIFEQASGRNQNF